MDGLEKKNIWVDLKYVNQADEENFLEDGRNDELTSPLLSRYFRKLRLKSRDSVWESEKISPLRKLLWSKFKDEWLDSFNLRKSCFSLGEKLKMKNSILTVAK